MTVSLKLKSFLERVNKSIAVAKEKGIVLTPEMARARMADLSMFVTDIPEIACIEDKKFEYNGIKIPVRIYSPDPQKDLPVLVYYHGGGHMCGSVSHYDPMARKISLAANIIVVSVDYRLSPENPFPDGVNDSFMVTKRVWDLLTHVKYKKQLCIGGDSAGGAIAASIIMRNQDTRALNIEKQVLIYPGVDYTMSTDSYRKNGKGFLLETERIKWYFDQYFQNQEIRKEVSPLFGKFSKNMPKTLVLTAEFDPLKDEGILYYKKVKEQGVYAEHYDFAGMIHAFMNLEDLVKKEVHSLYQKVADFLMM